MDLGDARTIGQRLRMIRNARGKSLRVTAELAGLSKSTLSQIERGERALDALSEIVALADVLQVAPSELTKLPVPAPANGETDVAVQAVRLAIRAVIHDLADGLALPAEVLRARVMAVVDALCQCEGEREVGAALPSLIRDLHTSIATGRDVAELLPLATWLHTQVTVPWLQLAGASVDLCSQTVQLAHDAAQKHDTPSPLALAAVAGARVLLADGAFDLARASVESVSVPMNTPETMQLAGFLALRQSRIAMIDNRPGDAGTALEHAGELAARTGEGNAYGLGFGPVNVGMFHVFGAVDAKDYEQAVNVAESLNPEMHANRSQRANYWVYYGRALARVRRRRDDAVMALRRAERLSPHRVQRNPLVREVLAELLTHTPPDSSAGREVRRMAYRADLPM